MAYQSVDSNTGKLLKCFEQLTTAQLEKTLAAAKTCFQTWRHTPWAVWGCMFNGGQTCCAAKRFIVMESVADKSSTRATAANWAT